MNFLPTLTYNLTKAYISSGKSSTNAFSQKVNDLNTSDKIGAIIFGSITFDSDIDFGIRLINVHTASTALSYNSSDYIDINAP